MPSVAGGAALPRCPASGATGCILRIVAAAAAVAGPRSPGDVDAASPGVETAESFLSLVEVGSFLSAVDGDAKRYKRHRSIAAVATKKIRARLAMRAHGRGWIEVAAPLRQAGCEHERCFCQLS